MDRWEWDDKVPVKERRDNTGVVMGKKQLVNKRESKWHLSPGKGGNIRKQSK